MSNYNERINNILSSLEQEIDLLRHTINIHNLQNEIRRIPDMGYRHRYNPYQPYYDLFQHRNLGSNRTNNTEIY